jgi:hypothetical protein
MDHVPFLQRESEPLYLAVLGESNRSHAILCGHSVCLQDNGCFWKVLDPLVSAAKRHPSSAEASR